MIKKIKDVYQKNNELIRDNIVLSIGMFFVGFAGYVFHFMMGRYLEPVEYGILGSMLAIIYMILIITNVIQTSITRFTSKFKIENNYGKISFLLKSSLKKIGVYSLVFALLFILFTPLIGKFLKIDDLMPIYLISIFVILGLLTPITRGILQGTQKFSSLSFSYMIEGVTKIILGVIAIFMGLRVNGAVLAIVLSYLVPLIIIFIPLRDILKKPVEKFKTKKVYFYSIPILITITLITLMYSIDMLLVKHFFTGTEAGYYSALSILGKVIFFTSTPISYVMFPKVIELYEHKKSKEQTHLLYKSMIIILGLSIPVNLFYFIFPEFTISLLFGQKYLIITPLLGVFGVMMTLLSLIYLISFYNLAVHNNKFIIILFLSLITEVLLISLFHESLAQIAYILLGVMIFQFIALMLTIVLNKKVKIQED